MRTDPCIIPLKPESAYQAFQNRRYFTALDGLRCLAILGVLLHHAPRLDSFPNFMDRGFLGVDLFFVLSGFLIVTLLLREKARKGKISLQKFYSRKLLRILPVYYGLLALLAMLYLLKFEDLESQRFFSTLPNYIAFVSNWKLEQAPNLGVAWALDTEMQFYLVWPLVEVFLLTPLKFIFLGIFLLLNQLTSFGVLDGFWNQIYGDGFDRQLEILQITFTPICFGIILAHLMHHQKTFELFSRVLSNRWASTVLFTTLLTLVAFSPTSITAGGFYRLLVQMAMVLLLAALVVKDGTPTHQVLNNWLLIEIGVVSYGIYLFHMLAYHVVREVSAPLNLGEFQQFLFELTLGGLLTMLVAELSFRYYEKPILQLKEKLK